MCHPFGEISQRLILPKLPRMNPWPEENSILIMDNCAIHKMEALRVIVEESGAKFQM